MGSVAIVGMACIFPDACSLLELWENVLAQRQAFRRVPPERLRIEDYFSADRNAPDCTYTDEAAFIEGYEFDRVRFRVAGSTFCSVDLAHWLALDVAARALADAGFPEGEGLPREATGVLVGNTLTGEFSRANTMRLRWPYVRRVVEAALVEDGWTWKQRHAFLNRLEARYKLPFPPVDEETLAGGLSNTIAGRICNYFDLKGGGYTVDGACASSLLAVITACSMLTGGDLDVALAGGVDLSLDPFELVGFAKTGALAAEEMRVYDVRSSGFWPGEGCGFVVLMRYEDAMAQGRRVYATIRGWGISSDGSGGITRPEIEGQILALRRAYRRAGFGIETVPYFEGHGTGTNVGDATELQALSLARREATADASVAFVGSIKANIGHTKAAAGVAGLIKATMAVHTQVLPPVTGCQEPHPALAGDTSNLRVPSEGGLWPADRPLRAGVSAMGFGGINTHIVLEGIPAERRRVLNRRERLLLSSYQDTELFLLDARDRGGLQRQVEHLLAFAGRLSRSELIDLAGQLARTVEAREVRAAIVTSKPAELVSKLEMLKSWLMEGTERRIDTRFGVFLGTGNTIPRIWFLFPGQGSPARLSGGAWSRRFELVRELYARANLPATGDGSSTAVAQPAIVTASLAGLRVLDRFGITACLAVGHSLGELTALHWAGGFDGEALLRISAVRGKTMSEWGSSTGAMASISAGQEEVEQLLDSEPVVIAGVNSPRQTVISGEAAAVAAVIARARERGLRAVNLPVSHAFHSPLVAAAAPILAAALENEDFRPLQRTVVSTVTGGPLGPDEDLRGLLTRQVTCPVRFSDAIQAAGEVDLFIEVGPGQVLSGLVADLVETPSIPLDVGGPSLKGLLQAVGAAFALGTPVNHAVLFEERFTRPFDLNWRPRFFINPCELAPVPEATAPPVRARVQEIKSEEVATVPPTFSSVASPLDLVRQIVAKRAELPLSAVKGSSRLLSDLHLNSIVVAQLVAEAALRLGLPPSVSPTEYADATVAEVAQALEELTRTATSVSTEQQERLAPGVDAWIRAFVVEFMESPLPSHQRSIPAGAGTWRVIAPPDHPLKGPLQEALSRWEGGGGIVVCLPPEPDESHIGLLLEGARAVLVGEESTRFVLVQHGGGAAAFARTLHLERPEVTTCTVDVPVDHPQALEWILAEARAAVGYSEAHYDPSGRRREPVLRVLSIPQEPAEIPLRPDDVLLVTGGGKGIAAECALSIARETGVRLALIGRSRPAEDAELSANLRRMAAAGVNFRYIPADVTDEEEIRAAVKEVEVSLGPITGILHGAGTNVPQLLSSLDEGAFLRTLAPKVRGARNLLAAVNPDHLRLFVAFSSLIARTGMRGEADYALANEWLTRLTERYQAEHPHCRCLAVEWSVWSGVGMGQRLGRVDALMREGITPIPPDEGISILRRLLSLKLPYASVVVTGRFGDPPTLKQEQRELPLLRFLERPIVHYPGVELVVEADLSPEKDLYLDEHVFSGQRLFPAVMGLEAMAQVAMALLGTSDLPVMENVSFDRPVVVPEGVPLTIRIAALAHDSERVAVVLRSAETAFQVDHFRATCHFGPQRLQPECTSLPFQCEESVELYVPIDPERDLYGGILFHRGRFRRLRGYRRLRATECIAEITPDNALIWFGRYLPQKLVLGDAAARDAAVHAIQACIPHATLLPIGVKRLGLSSMDAPGPYVVWAWERSREGSTFIYDVIVRGLDGSVLEHWDGLRLQAVNQTTSKEPWVGPLLAPYIERRLQELIPGSNVSVALDHNSNSDRRHRSDQAIQRALGKTVPVWRRPDGKPEIQGSSEVSSAHSKNVTLAIEGPGPLACDIEPVVTRPVSIWRDLVGLERFKLAEVIRRETGEDQDTVITRIWTAGECLKKAGAMANAPLVLLARTADGWVLLSSGSLIVATFAAQVRGFERGLVLAVLVRGSGDARL